jgi:TonB family protein
MCQPRIALISGLRAWATALILSLGVFFATGMPGRAQVNDSPGSYSGESVGGTLRRLTENDLLLQISTGKILRFRLLAKTEFRGKDGKPVRDSLIRPGDGIAVYVSPEDVETALYVILLKSGSDAERQFGAVPVDGPSIVAPEPSDFDTKATEKTMPNSGSPPAPGLPANNPTVPPPAMPALVITGRVEPEYSPDARAAGLQGTVLLSLEVTPEGTVASVRLRRGLGLGLDERAVAAARQWRYQPFIANGRPRMDAVEVTFQLEHREPWLVSGSRFTFPIVRGPFVKPALIRYVSPDSGACSGELLYVPVDLTVGTDGKPTDVRVGGAINAGVGKSAIAAVESWRFRPGTADGKKEITSGTIVLECSAPTSASDGVFSVGSGVSPPTIVFKVDPEYSEEARKAKFNGSVLLAITVDSTGRARDIHVVRALGMGLDDEAIAAVTQWRFKPGTKGGQPVNVKAQVAVNFRLL